MLATKTALQVKKDWEEVDKVKKDAAEFLLFDAMRHFQ